MANEGDRIEVQFTETEALAQRLLDQIEKDIALAQAVGDQMEVSRLQAKRQAIGGPQQYVREKAQIEEDTAALARENAVRRQGLEVELATLDALKQQAEVRAAIMGESEQFFASQTAAQQAAYTRATAPAGALGYEAPGFARGEYAGALEAAAATQGAQRAAAARTAAAAAQAERDAIAATAAEEQRVTAQLAQQSALRRASFEEIRQQAFQVGAGRAAWQPGQREGLVGGPQGAAAGAIGGAYTADEAALARYNAALGEYQGYASRADLTSTKLAASFQRLGLTEAEASNAMRAHGALTTEWLGALARGETTVSEFGYQIGATIGKFAGWTAAAAATFAGLGAITEFGKGAIDSANAVGQLGRTIEGVNTDKAAQAFRDLSRDTDVSLKDAGDAVFQFSRTFHNLPDAVAAARLGLSALQLDNVKLADSVKAVTSIHQQFGLTAQQMSGVYDMLAAGQREYNARINEMIPLLAKSTGAVKNAGGDLTQLMQIAVVALRTTQQGGAQVGTALYRAAATQVPKNAGQLVTEFGLGRDINPATGQGDVTQLILDAIRKSATLPGSQRRQLANLIFGQQYGGRLGALFGPQAADLLDQVTGQRNRPGGPGPITPAATQDALKSELARQLQQVRKELDQFVFGLQRLGSALAESGALAPLGLALKGVVASLNLVTHLIEIFDQMPQPMREMISLFVELRAAMLFFSRTRIGSSAPFFTRIPGFRPSEATRARAELAIGNRAAMSAVGDEIARNTSTQLQNQARIAALDQERSALIAKAGGEEALTAEQLERSNAITAKIVDLQSKQTRLEEDRLAQVAAQSELQQRQVMLTATSRYRRGSDAWVLGQRRAASAGAEAGAADAAQEAALVEGSTAQAGLARYKQRLVGAFASAKIASIGATQALRGEAAALYTATVATDEEIAATAASTSALAGFAGRIGGMIAAIDPLLIALIGIPFALQEISRLKHHTQLTSRDIPAADSLDQLRKTVRDAQRNLGGEPTSFGPSLGGINPFSESEDSYDARRANVAAQQGLLQSLQRARQRTYASPVRQVGYSLKELGQEAADDQRAFEEHRISKEEFIRRMNELKRSAQSSIDVITAPSAKAANQAMKDFNNTVQAIFQQGLFQGGKVDPKNPFAQFSAIADPKVLTKQLQALDDISKIYGTTNDALQKAAFGFAYMASRYSGSKDDTTLQAVYSAQQGLINAVTKNVQDWLHAASTATTNSGQQGDINQALAQVNKARSDAQIAFAAIFRVDAGNLTKLRADHAAYNQILAQFGDQFKAVVDAELALMKSESDVTVSQIQGISPEADIQRAQSTIAGLKGELAWAQSHHADAQTINGLISQINNAETALLKQQVDNARGILQAQGQLAVASITGISPADDIARAQAAVGSAQQLLAFDQSHGAGTKAILQDQAQLDQQIYALNQALQANAQRIEQDAIAFVQAQAALAEANTTSVIGQAKEQLSADIQALAFIQPQDYRTYQEYQTAVLQQKAKIAQDQRNVRQQIVDQDMRTLQFELHTQQITDQQYVDGLQQLLKMKKLTLQERQDIMTQIWDTLHQSAVDLNVGQIKLPTTYEVRKALQAGLRAGGWGQHPAQQGIIATNNIDQKVNVYVTVQGGSDLKRITDAIAKGIGAVNGQAKAAALI